MQEQTDDQLDQLIINSYKDSAHLQQLVGRYAELLTASNANIIKQYKGQIEEVCKKWEAEDESIKGIRMYVIGMSHYFSAQFQDGKTALGEAIKLLNDTVHTDFFAMSNMMYGGINRSLGELDVAIKHFVIGGDLLSSNGSFAIFKGLVYYQLAEINIQINDFEEAEKFYKIAVDVAEDLNNDMSKFRAYAGMGNFHLSQNNLEKCKYYLDLSLSIEGLTESQKSRSYCDLGIYYYQRNDFVNSEKTLRKSYEVRIEADLKDAASTSLINLAKTQIALDQTDNALDSLVEGLDLCLASKSKAKIMECYHLMAKIYAKQAKWQKSTEAYEKYDELQLELNTKQLQNIYDLKNGKIKKQKAEIEEVHKEITDSINYAKRIQGAILPSSKTMNSLLANSFILYKPKDVVAGDFYWVQQVENKILFAAADCTGHGVPGAMISVVCYNALNRSTREYGLSDPNTILDKTREIVIQEFGKSDEDVKDGMDIALCVLEGKKLNYAGAYNPLWIIREGEIIETKANKQPIGKGDDLSPYTNHSFDLLSGDIIYIFSDGYVDQFGGEKGKKFKAKAFRSLLLSIRDEPMERQKALLDETFENWRGNLDQIDDVCVIGVKIK